MKPLEIIVARLGERLCVLTREGWVAFGDAAEGALAAVERLSFIMEGDALRLQPTIYSEALIRKAAETDPKFSPERVRTLDDLVRPNDFARWLRAQERA